ncbi:hypothetical protein NPIL_502111 [Nephila pilipes]|uniref:Uncharacterized protein n=1 Tax=Nephila pilipes TaxID=299642 RepID=A0A8X6PJP2_NEPPI|nr:hypothetical protein NPIL_502111 [Nephila pilipes]
MSSPSSSLVKTEERSSSENQGQYFNFKKDFTHKSTAQTCSEESKTKKMKMKSSRMFCFDKITVILQDHDENRTFGYRTVERIMKKKSSSTDRSLTHIK